MKAIFVIFLLFPLFCWAGGSGGGNGGDTVRMRFFSIGHNIIDYYKSGFKNIQSVVSDPEELRNYLNIKVVKTSVELLYDNLGNPVNAIGENNRIILYVGDAYKELSWTNILKDQRSAQVLILHELLRAHGVNDDNYIYSNIVLKEQDIIEGKKFHFRWSIDSEEAINSALALSFKSMDLEEEISIYEKTFEKIKSINNLPYANFISLQVNLSENISTSDSFRGSKISLMRKDLRQTKDLIPIIDIMAYRRIKNQEDVNTLNKIVILLLKDFSHKFSEFSYVDNAVFSQNLSELLVALNADDRFKHGCSNVTDILQSVKDNLNQGVQKREILRKIQLAIFTLQQGHC